MDALPASIKHGSRWINHFSQLLIDRTDNSRHSNFPAFYPHHPYMEGCGYFRWHRPYIWQMQISCNARRPVSIKHSTPQRYGQGEDVDEFSVLLALSAQKSCHLFETPLASPGRDKESMPTGRPTRQLTWFIYFLSLACWNQHYDIPLTSIGILIRPMTAIHQLWSSSWRANGLVIYAMYAQTLP